jgi:broad specificity phosphatase PhoE
MTSITIVRHATTEWMEQGRVHGRLDSPLSARGKREARLAGLSLGHTDFDSFYTSPALRAVETARIIGQEIDRAPAILDGLREMDFGCVEGRALDLPPGARPSIWFYLRWALALPFLMVTAEPWPHFTRRIAQTLRTIVEMHSGERILVVAHGAVHSAMLRTIMPGARKLLTLRYRLVPCGITQIEVGPDGRGSVISLNETGHLVG